MLWNTGIWMLMRQFLKEWAYWEWEVPQQLDDFCSHDTLYITSNMCFFLHSQWLLNQWYKCYGQFNNSKVVSSQPTHTMFPTSMNLAFARTLSDDAIVVFEQANSNSQCVREEHSWTKWKLRILDFCHVDWLYSHSLGPAWVSKEQVKMYTLLDNMHSANSKPGIWLY